MSHVVFLRAIYYAAGRHDQKERPHATSVLDPLLFANEAEKRDARCTQDMQRIYEELQP